MSDPHSGPRSAGSVGEIAGVLGDLAVFSRLGARSRAVLAGACRRVEVQAGQVVVRRGEPGDAMYVVHSGLLEVLGGAEEANRLRVLRPGVAFGELALLASAPRNATVRAVRDSTLWELPRPAFDALLASDAEFARSMVQVLTRLVHETAPTDRPEVPPVRVVAVLPLHRGTPTSLLVDAFTATAPEGRVHVCQGPPDADPRAWPLAVERLEPVHDVVALVASADRDEWFKFCAREADRVVVVAASDARLVPFDQVAAPDLVLFGPRRDRAVSRSLRAVAPRAHHLIGRETDAEAAGRAARRILGRSVGVVLSGGGARGLAHVGVLDAFADAGVVVDRFGGTSMGALVGALAAQGSTPSELREVLRRELVDRRPFADYVVPRVALIRARRAQAMLERLFGDLHVEETPRSFFCVSADLVTAAPVVHTDGWMVAAVGASMSLPGIAPPVRDGERMLVDGGVLDNLPVEVMAAAGEGPVVAVDVLARGMPGARRASRRGRGSGLPTLVETLARASTLASRRLADAQHALAALTIVPDLAGIGLLEFRQFDAIVAAGRRAAEELLATAGPGRRPWE